MRLAALIGWTFLALLASSVPMRADTRVALVIGNSTYQSVSALPNPVNDANDISASLRRLGFDVKTLTNAKFDDMRRALISFGQQARGADFAVVFFAGHGMEIGGDNWLIPVDAQLATDIDVASETIGLQTLTRAVSNTTKLGLVILDACRNNPFLPKMQRTSMTRAVDRGFVRVEPNDNVLVAYSARDGTTANDGAGRNSPFTSSLLKNIETPGLEVRFLFANVRDDVRAATQREQQPYIYGSLSKDLVYLKAPTGVAGEPSQVARLPEQLEPQAKPTADPPAVTSATFLPALGLTLASARSVSGNGPDGVVITKVEQKGPAVGRGLKEGTVILEVSGKLVGSPADVGEAIKLAARDNKKNVLLRISGFSYFVAVPLAN